MDESIVTSSFPRKYSRFGNSKTCREFCTRLLKGAERMIRDAGTHNPFLFLITKDEIKIAQFIEPRDLEEQEVIKQGVVNALASDRYLAVAYIAEAWTKRTAEGDRLETARGKDLECDFESNESVIVWGQQDGETWIGFFDITRGMNADVVECTEYVLERISSRSKIKNLHDIWDDT